ncbi:MAG: hypothetical protein R6U36_10900 [Candidatus Fermentibacteraceae bacterium]
MAETYSGGPKQAAGGAGEVQKAYPRLRYAGLWVFGVTLGLFEAAIVVYLRRIVCPEGFSFPLSDMGSQLLAVELGREAASLLMLGGVALAAARRRREVLPIFFLTFGIWDILYYVFLQIVLGWPGGLGTWDLLFLIPAPWSSPVWAPVLIALLFVAVPSWLLLRRRGSAYRPPDRWAMLAGGLLCLASFLYNAGGLMEGGVPGSFPLWLYIPGLGLMVWGAVKGALRR